MLEEVDPLPRAQRQPACIYGYAQMRLRQRRANVRGHVVGTFGGVAIHAGVISSDAEVCWQNTVSKPVRVVSALARIVKD